MSSTEGSFYVTGGTLRPDAPSYVERQADTDLYDALQRGEFCYILTARQMGKSSLMNRTAARLRKDGVAVVMLDLTRIGQNLAVEQWYDGLLADLGRQLDLEDELEEYWLERPHLGPLQRWMGALQNVVLPALQAPASSKLKVEGSRLSGSSTFNLQPSNLQPAAGRLVIFVDEIDAVRSLPFSADEFFAGIRECYTRRAQEPVFHRLAFCLLGVAAPTDLIRDTRITPFNIGQRIELNDFSEAEAAPLATGLARHGQNGTELLQRVLYWTGGYPYLTQRLCQAVAERLTTDDRPPTTDGSSSALVGGRWSVVDQLCEALFLSASARERDDNLLFVRERLLKSEADRASLLDLYARMLSGTRVPADDTNQLIGILRLAGITRLVDVRRQASGVSSDGGWRRLLRRCWPLPLTDALRLTSDACLVVRNRIYARVFDREWVRQHMPDAELRRQRAAFRRGLMRATTVAGVVLALMGGLAAAAVYQGREARRQQELAEERAERGRRDLYVRSMSVALQALDEGNQGRASDLVEQQRPRRGQVDLRGWEWRYLWQQCQSDSFLTLPGPTQPDGGVAFSPDGRTLALAGKDLKVRLWKLARSPDPRSPVTLQGEPALLTGCKGMIRMLAFSADGRVLAAAGYENAIRLWDVATRRSIGDPLPLSEGGVTGPGLAFSVNGLLAVRDGPKVIRLWDSRRRWRALPTIQSEGEFETNPALDFSPNGKLLAYTAGKTVQIRRLADGRETTLRGPSALASGVAFSPDGRTVATSGADETVGLWDATTGRWRSSLKGHSSSAIPVAFARDGTVVSGGWDTTIRLWDARTGRERARLLGHGGPVTVIALSPDGKTLASTGLDGTARLWNTAPRPAAAVVLPGQARMIVVWYLAFSGDGQKLATGALDGIARLWDLATNGPPRAFRVDAERAGMIQVALSHDGETLVAGRVGLITGFGGGVRAWIVATGTEIFHLNTRLSAMALSPDGRHLALSTPHDPAELWDIRRRRRLVQDQATFSGRDR